MYGSMVVAEGMALRHPIRKDTAMTTRMVCSALRMTYKNILSCEGQPEGWLRYETAHPIYLYLNLASNMVRK